ncbi:hypothetical protein [Cesiribacter andamanensis]|uniref:Uncharacterized protein n=1 Tax=Cesiribacter andamanensis AMV16 TaxID=1279009 RepID=M7N8I4_9BACT|nr:hypothetical protein [Cesiribacter andamanensis]EMR03526.1 hypothetical protein ADICEAN_01293 [Cesiribacter andamanensis AMV16]
MGWLPRLLLLASFWLMAFTARGQVDIRAELEAWVQACNPQAGLDSATLYILDGVIVSAEDLFGKEAKQGLSPHALLSIHYLSAKEAHASLPHWHGSGILILTSLHQQKRREIRRGLQEALLLFEKRAFRSAPISSNSGDPVLLIDGSPIPHDEARSLLESLRPGALKALHYSPCAFPTALFGQNAKNGLLRIWTGRM